MLSQVRTIFLFLLTGIFFFPVFALASTTDGTVPADSYAWGENLGWINLGCNGCNVHVTDSAVTGYGWSHNFGWVNFSPANGGATNSSEGALGGYAWSAQKGWINMAGVTINSSGRFTGTAGTQGSEAGRISFSCDNCNVTTDWRPASVRNQNQNQGGGGGGGGGSYTPTVQTSTTTPNTSPVSEGQKPDHVEAHNEALTINQEQSGRYTKDTNEGRVIVEVPAKSVTSKVTFFIQIEPTVSLNEHLTVVNRELVNGTFYEIFAADQNGNFIHTFSSPITITLPVPINLQRARNIGVYWFNETNNQWVLIPDVVFADNKAVFQINHLTKFAIFGILNEDQPVENNNEPELRLPIKGISTPSGESRIPEQLFDINLELDQARIEGIERLTARVIFMSFGKVPTPVDLTFDILDSAGSVARTEKDNVTVETEKVFAKIFSGFELAPGQYTLRLTTLYNTSVKDEFSQPFEIITAQSTEQASSYRRVWVAISVLAVILILVFLVKRKKQNNG